MFATAKCFIHALPLLINTVFIIFHCTEGFVFENKNIVHENNVTDEDLIINFGINDEDYEMNGEAKENVDTNVEKNGLEGFANFNMTELLENLIRYGKNPQTSKIPMTVDLNNAKGKREVQVGIKQDFQVSTTTEKNRNHVPRLEILDFIKMLKYSNHTEGSIFSYKSLLGFIYEFSEHSEHNVLALPIWSIVLIWLLVYFIVAIPLWCTRDWCSCCLFCKFFKPRETIREAKKYILLNPPGILVTKRGGIIHYEPTEREKDCYERFVHFIRTL